MLFVIAARNVDEHATVGLRNTLQRCVEQSCTVGSRIQADRIGIRGLGMNAHERHRLAIKRTLYQREGLAAFQHTLVLDRVELTMARPYALFADPLD
jgi:hypothetical protein